MKILKQAGVFSMLVLMIISSLGISFYLHSCSCSGETTIGLGTEFSDHKLSACCTSCSTVAGNMNHNPAFTKKGCCNNRLYFYLLPVAPDHAVKYLSPLTEKILFNIISVFNADTAPESLDGSFTLMHDPPSPRSGKLLVYFIRQIKIPFSAC
jgi:hypothetical protein